MASKSKRPIFYIFATAAVTLIIVGALALATGAVLENIRFTKATGQIFWLVGQVRAAAAEQKGFAQSSGEDIWNGLTILGRLPPDTPRTNPWRGDLRATTVPTGMRVETTLPVHECRRLALSLLDRNMADIGLLSLEAQSYNDSKWTPIYALQGGPIHASVIVGQACGAAPYARLALVFKIR